MSRLNAPTAALALAAALLAGCATDGADRVLSVDATGAVIGVVYLDRDGNLEVDPTIDGAAPGVRLSLVLRGTQQQLATATSDGTGSYTFANVPVGSYRVAVDTTTIGDSLRVARIDTADVTITASDTAIVLVGVSYRMVGIADAKRLDVGKRIFIQGVTLNAWSAFGDSTVHVADATGAIRLTRLPSLNIPAGDSVRVLGTVDLRDGRPVLTDVAAFRIGQGSIPAPHAVSTTTAAAAAAGTLDAALARVTGAVVTSVQTTPDNDVDLTVDDGSGPLVIRIDRDANIPAAGLVPGVLLDATGVLVPGAAGAWRLKPRSASDLEVDYRAVTVAEARNEPVGQLVLVRGVALNAWNSFGDATVHVADATGAIRALNVPQVAVQAGDSVRAVGRIAVQDGQPVLAAATVFPGGSTAQPLQPQPVLTTVAANAAGGALDAALVRIENATILAVEIPSGTNDRRVRVDDGSGALDVLVHATTAISFADLVPQGVLAATGVLVPAGGGAWQLKPRTSQDVAVAFETVKVADARTSVPVGTLVQIEGIALNDRNAFGDGTVHLYDETGTIRTFILFSSSASIAAGDSVRLRGTVRIRDGQRVLDAVTPTPLKVGVGTPAAISLSIQDAASASGGSLDAALAVVRNVRVAENNAAGPDRILVVDQSGGSDQLEIYLHSSTITSPSQYAVGTILDVTGVLVPVPGENRWRLKPRGDTDIVVK